MISCQHDAAIIEIHTRNPNLCYLCSSLQLCLRYVMMYPDNPDNFTSRGMLVDAVKLLVAVKKVLQYPIPSCSVSGFDQFEIT